MGIINKGRAVPYETVRQVELKGRIVAASA